MHITVQIELFHYLGTCLLCLRFPLSFGSPNIPVVAEDAGNPNFRLDQTYRNVSEWTVHFLTFSQLISSQSLNLGGRRGTTDGVATIPYHPSPSSAAPIPIRSLMLSSHLFFCLPLLLAPFTVPCRIVFAMPEDLEMWPYHLSFRIFNHG